MNKIIISTLAGVILATTSVSAMSTTTMMDLDMMKKDAMKKEMMGSSTMKDDKMMMDESKEKMYDMTNSKSKKEDIKTLQMMLVAKGYLKMPMGATHGYYGNLTKKAFAKYKNAKMMMKDDIMKKDMMNTNTMMEGKIMASGTRMSN